LLLCLTLSHTSGQDVIGTRAGLSNRYVTSIVQDTKELIWIGTRNGLNCYDGYTFKRFFSYTHDLQLSSSFITVVYQSANGTLFIGTQSGLNIVSPDTSHQTRVLFSNKTITSISSSTHKNIFIATGEGELIELDSNLHSRLVLRTKGKISLLQTDAHGKLWFCIASPKSIYCLSPNGIVSQPIPGEIKGFYKIFDDTLLSCNVSQGLQLHDVKTGNKIDCRSLDSINALYTNPGIIYRDHKRNFWINFGNGTLIKLNLTNGQTENYSYFFSGAFFTNKITCISEDNNGLIWVGTEGGLIKIPQPPGYFKQHLVNQNPAKINDYISTRGILSDSSGNVYIGTYKGLYILSKKTNQQRLILLDNKKFHSDLPSPHQLIWLKKDVILLTSYTKGLLTFDTRKQQFDYACKKLNNTQLLGLFKSRSGIIWVGSYKGIYQYNPTNMELHALSLKDQNGHSVDGTVWCFQEDNKGNIWVGTNTGLYKIGPHYQVIRYHTLSQPSLSNNEILALHIESDTSLWLASKGGGLIHFNTLANTLKWFNTNDGLSDNIVYGILPDNDGNLWLSTESGLSRFNKKNGLFHNYFEQDGISNNEFNAGSFHKNSEGEFYMGGINGVTSFDPSSFNQSQWKPHIILTSLTSGNKSIHFRQPDENHPITVHLPYDDKSLFLSFTLNDFYEPQFNTFSYTIEGLDDHWTKLGAQNFMRITDLPAGTYTLLVKGSNMNGMESSNVITITLNVAQVFYKQSWFIISFILMLSVIIYGIVKFRLNQLLEVQKLRTKIASDLHDEVGSMLTRISILTELLKYQKLTNPEIEQIASVSRMATTTMSDVLWSIDARNDKIGNLIDRMRDHADSLLLPLHKNIVFHTHNINTTFSMKMQERQNILLIFKEAINNIAKHSNATEVIIHFERKTEGLFLSVADNGTDVHLSKNGQGLKNMEMRARELNASISFDTHSGFCIVITFNAK
jgi:ligand-binding sensor domain-containing protein/two-component sensor histidine kinase